MAFFRHFLLLLIICFTFTAESTTQWYDTCSGAAVAKNGTQLSSNIDRLLKKLVSGTTSNAYAAASQGSSNDRVYGLAQCRGDVSKSDCSDCVRLATSEIRELCPTQTDARAWYEYCFVRYDTKYFLGKVDASIFNVVDNPADQTVTDAGTFKKTLGALVNNITSQAMKPQNKGLGKGSSSFANSTNNSLYALAQCTGDVSPASCAHCMGLVTQKYKASCANKVGCRVFFSSCIFRYELHEFYF